MSIAAAFQPMGQTVAVVTNAGASTSSNATISLFGNGTGFVFNVGAAANQLVLQPSQVRIANSGTSPVFVSFNQAARTAVIPVAGTNQLEFPVLPGTVEIFSGLGWAAGVPPTIIVATISAGVSQTLYLTFGEGL